MCFAAFFLAQAGVLYGLNVTTHWSVARKLASEYPAVNVNDDANFIQSVHIWTCAGVYAAIDLSLALVGQEIALQVARELVLYLKRPNLGQTMSLESLAERVSMSSRNLRRLF